MKRVRAVLFDLDHTLFDTEKTERHALAEVSRVVGVPAGRRSLQAYRTVNTHVWAEYRAGRVTSQELRVLRFHLWLEAMDRDPAHARKLAPLYLKAFSSRGDLLPGASRAIRSIGQLDLRLGVVTNGIDRVQRTRLRASNLMDAFQVVITSERAGFTKPDSRIMDIALRRLRVDASETVYVGDDLQVDGLAANRATMRFVWFNPKGEAPAKDSAVKIDYQVRRLQDIEPLLRR